jgi:hypothetical protein
MVGADNIDDGGDRCGLLQGSRCCQRGVDGGVCCRVPLALPVLGHGSLETVGPGSSTSR